MCIARPRPPPRCYEIRMRARIIIRLFEGEMSNNRVVIQGTEGFWTVLWRMVVGLCRCAVSL